MNSDYIGIDNAVYSPYVCPALTITGSPGPGTWGVAYSVALSQTGALGPPNFAVTAGALPPGLTLSSSGTISGTPTATGTYNFTVTVNDASGCSGSQPYSVTISPTVPAAPQAVSAVAGDAEAEVSFGTPANDGGSAITGYTATCTDGGDAQSESGSLSPIVVTGLTNGATYTCTVAASNGVGTGPASAPSNSVTPKGNQTIVFDPQADQTYSPGGTFAIDPPAVASSGLEVEYGSSTTDVCTVSGATVSILAAGTCILTADQAGDVAWNPAPQVDQALEILAAAQVLDFPAQTVSSRWLRVGTTFEIDPLASSAVPNSGQPIVYSSLDPAVCSLIDTTLTMEGEGTCRIAADQAGDDNYQAAAQVEVQVALVIPTEADLWIEKTTDDATARIGDTVAYTIVVGNLGPADANDVRVLDLPPDRLDPDSVVWACLDAVGTVCPDPDADAGELDVILTSLPQDASVMFELLGRVGPAAEPADDFTAFENTASVSLPPGSGLTDPEQGNNESAASVQVIPDRIFGSGFEALPLD